MSEPLPILLWRDLDGARRRRVLARPASSRDTDLLERVRGIVERVRDEGDTAVAELTRELDGVAPGVSLVDPDAPARAWEQMPETARRALRHARDNVARFHEAQRTPLPSVTVQEGVHCRQERRPIDSVGLYVPGGSAPLPSALLMLAVPAAIAGCVRRVVCSPPQRDGQVSPVILAAAHLCGVDEIHAVGGAQAVAAMAYGTESLAPVDKIFGPGNAYVTAAKLLVAQDPDGAVCDLPAGPSEVLVIADAQARPDVVAADLLAQAEHGVDSQVLLFTDSEVLAADVTAAVADQVPRRARARVIRQSLAHARVLVFDDLDAAFEASNRYAPEHLILNLRDAAARVADVTSAGSVFVGPWAAETFGDYCSGTNHVLPTNGFARACSGVTLGAFEKLISVQDMDANGFAALADTAATLAQLEGLDAHAAAVDVRRAVLAGRGTAA